MKKAISNFYFETAPTFTSLRSLRKMYLKTKIIRKKLVFKIVFKVKNLIGKSKKLNIFYIFLIIKIRNGNVNSNLIKYLKKKFQMFEIDFKSFRAIFYKGDIDECK